MLGGVPGEIQQKISRKNSPRKLEESREGIIEIFPVRTPKKIMLETPGENQEKKQSKRSLNNPRRYCRRNLKRLSFRNLERPFRKTRLENS